MTDFSTKIEVYLDCDFDSGSGTTCVPVIRNETCGSKDVVSFRGRKGTLYMIYVTALDNASVGFFTLSITPGKYFHELAKPIAFYVFVGYALFFCLFSCVGLVAAISALVYACVRRNHLDYLKIVN